MAKYLKAYETLQDFMDAGGQKNMIVPGIAWVRQGDTVYFNVGTQEEDDKEIPVYVALKLGSFLLSDKKTVVSQASITESQKADVIGIFVGVNKMTNKPMFASVKALTDNELTTPIAFCNGILGRVSNGNDVYRLKGEPSSYSFYEVNSTDVVGEEGKIAITNLNTSDQNTSVAKTRAVHDFGGISNTNAWLSQIESIEGVEISDFPVFNLLKSNFDSDWYLPSAGELECARTNGFKSGSLIESALKILGSAKTINNNGGYWTSTLKQNARHDNNSDIMSSDVIYWVKQTHDVLDAWGIDLNNADIRILPFIQIEVNSIYASINTVTLDEFNTDNSDYKITDNVIFKSGVDTGSGTGSFRRIPSVAITNKGNYIAACEDRPTVADETNTSILFARRNYSATTWEYRTLLAYDESASLKYMNPMFVIDRTGVHGAKGRIYLWVLAYRKDMSTNQAKAVSATTEEGDSLYMYSDDDGKTWSNPISTKDKWNSTKFKCSWVAATNGIQMSDGTLVLPAMATKTDNNWYSGLIYKRVGSDWKYSNTTPHAGDNEVAIFEGNDGKLYLNARSNDKNATPSYKRNCYTYDFVNDTFTAVSNDFDPRQLECQADIDKIENMYVMSFDYNTNMNTAASTYNKRMNMSLWVSNDGINGWTRSVEIQNGSNLGYSNMDYFEKDLAYVYEGNDGIHFLQMPQIVPQLKTTLEEVNNPTVIPISAITISGDSEVFGISKQYTATIEPSNYTEKYRWVLSGTNDSNYATLTSEGLLTPKNLGRSNQTTVSGMNNYYKPNVTVACVSNSYGATATKSVRVQYKEDVEFVDWIKQEGSGSQKSGLGYVDYYESKLNQCEVYTFKLKVKTGSVVPTGTTYFAAPCTGDISHNSVYFSIYINSNGISIEERDGANNTYSGLTYSSTIEPNTVYEIVATSNFGNNSSSSTQAGTLTLKVNNSDVVSKSFDSLSPIGMQRFYAIPNFIGDAFNGQIYYIQAYEGNTLKFDLRAALRKSDNVYGMYSNLSGQFYPSITTAFSGGYDETVYVQDFTLSAPQTINKSGNVTISNITPVTANERIQFSIISGAEYATIDQNGNITVNENVENQTITVKAHTNAKDETVNIVVSNIETYTDVGWVMNTVSETAAGGPKSGNGDSVAKICGINPFSSATTKVKFEAVVSMSAIDDAEEDFVQILNHNGNAFCTLGFYQRGLYGNGGNSGNLQNQKVTLNANEKINVSYEFDWSTKKGNLEVNGSGVTKDNWTALSSNYVSFANGTNTLTLLSAGNKKDVSHPIYRGKFYSFKLYINGKDTPTLDMKPVKRDSDNVYGMYDIIHNQFYPSSTSTPFLGGNDN